MREFDSESVNLISKCGHNCIVCPYMKECTELTFENQLNFKIRHKMNCNTKYCIYVLFCKNCSFSYIGECEDIFDRTYKHIHSQKNANYRSQYCDKHFFNCCKKLNNFNFNVIPFFKCSNEDVVGILFY